MLNLALIGCGAVSENLHLPAILRRGDVRLMAAVDKDARRARLIAQKSGARPFVTIAEALPHFDAAIVALPHHLHAVVSIELLEAGKHVLVEKPMALTSAECDAMIAAAERGGATLTVGQMRRFCPAVSVAKALLDHELIGRINRFEILEGSVYDWPVTSDFFFRKETAGGGVLLDTGAHTFDTLLWLLGEAEQIEYRDDSYGGVEADCVVRMTMRSGAQGYVELSRTRELPTVLRIEGERGSMAIDYKRNEIDLTIGGRVHPPWCLPISHPAHSNIHIWLLMIALQLDNWIDALRSGGAPLVTGTEGRRVIDFIEKCYRNRKTWELPWMHSSALDSR